MKAYNYQCPKCGFDGETEESRREKEARVDFSPANDLKKYDRIVKTSHDVVPCPECDGMVEENGRETYKSMEIVGGPLGGENILPLLQDEKDKFVPYKSETLNRRIDTVEEMRKGYLQMWSAGKESVKEVASAEDTQEAKQTEVKRRGRPRKEETINA